MRYDDYSQTHFVTGLAVATVTADTDGLTIDTREFESLSFVASAGVSTGSDGSNFIEFEVEESDDDSTWTDVADADLLFSQTGTNSGTFGKLDSTGAAKFQTGYRGVKRYVRVTANVTGTVSAPLSVMAVGCRSKQANVNPVTV